MEASQKTNYQELAAEYARNRRVHPDVLERLLLAAVEARDVLEVGCGSGNYYEAIATTTNARVVGIDPSSAMIEQLLERLPAAETKVASGEAIPYPDSSFDMVFSVDVIHHVTDRDAYFTEVMRVLRHGGVVMTATDSEEDIVRRIPLSSHFPETIPHERRRYPSITAIREAMSRSGFDLLPSEQIERNMTLTDISQFRNKAFSVLHLISDEEHRRGIERLEADLANGPIAARSLYTLVIGKKP
jgi:ubiquinone/menaquinone biosynthesis C-methylase UbiE